MRIELQRQLFIGVRIDNKLRDALDHCPSRDRVYFDGSDPRYLSVLRSDGTGDSYLGKPIDGGTPAVAMDDLKRNILSILTRVAQGRRSENDVKVFALDPGEPAPEPPRRTHGQDEPRGAE